MNIPCRLCMEFGQDQEALQNQIFKYLDSLNDDDRTDDDHYEKRLKHCDACVDHRQGLCRYCGCFVVVRAAKKQMSCPHPDGDRWKK